MRSFSLAVYRAASGVLAPFAAWRLKRAVADDPVLLAAQRERHGDVPEGGGELWVHAASVGEVQAVAPLVTALADAYPERPIVHSTMTHTGRRMVAALHAGAVNALFAPLDSPRCVARWLDRRQPAALLLAETELWPVLLEACARRGVPVAMVSASLSETSARRLSRFPGLVRTLLGPVDPILCQSEADRARFIRLGADPARVRVTGNLKADATRPEAPEAAQWAQCWYGRKSWIAASTHPGEDELMVRAHRLLRDRLGDLLLVLVPRHPERAFALAERLRGQGWSVALPDELAPDSRPEIVIVDRIGVLAALYACVDVAVVCGSFVPEVGGHNLLEAATAARPVITGPWTAAQQAHVEVLERAQALFRLTAPDAEAMAAQVALFMNDPGRAAEAGARARAAAHRERGVVTRTFEALRPWLARLPGA
ncbi:MAG: lipid IV(A) 3-deoxy-D-manno-octulosonic acid transferase [Wenzhouxiangellaceae bacterium]